MNEAAYASRIERLETRLRKAHTTEQSLRGQLRDAAAKTERLKAELISVYDQDEVVRRMVDAEHDAADARCRADDMTRRALKAEAAIMLGSETCQWRVATNLDRLLICGADASSEWEVPLCAEHEAVMNGRMHRRRLAVAAVADREARAALETKGRVYFLQRDDGCVKIGYSTRVKTRQADLEREHGPLVLLGLRVGGPVVEADLHRRFWKHRLGRTEWFRPVESVLREASKCRLHLR